MSQSSSGANNDAAATRRIIKAKRPVKSDVPSTMSQSSSSSSSTANTDAAAEKEINKLIKDAARVFNETMDESRCKVRFSFDPMDVTFIAAKEILGPTKLLRYLKQNLQCHSDSMVDDDWDETYEQCTRLGQIFVPKNKPDYQKFDDDYEGKDPLDIGRVQSMCNRCFSVHNLGGIDNYADFWFGKEAEEYFGLNGLRRVINTGRVSGLRLNGRGGCLEPDRRHSGKYPLLCGNLTTVAGLLLDGHIWEMYWNILKNHYLDKKEVDEIEARAEELGKLRSSLSDSDSDSYY